MFAIYNGPSIALMFLSLGVGAGGADLVSAQSWADAHPRRAEAPERLDDEQRRPPGTGR
jgi:hypothetical protein